MCGIAGLFNLDPAVIGKAQRDVVLRAMTDAIAHRGPDGSGLWHDDRARCSLGHRRLSIIDTSDAGLQPMMSADGRWIISFNGEIYNFKSLRSDLAAQGAVFHGRTDTEVLLQALAYWGVEALGRIDGMYAFAAFDILSGQLLLARDAFGEKPLYYAELPGGGLAFASELQALENVPGIDLSVCPDAVAELLMFQYIGAPRTIYRSVRKLPPGHWMTAAPGQPLKMGPHFEFRPGASGFDLRPIGQMADELEALMVESLRGRLQSDVPLGAFLSGGVDSSTVCALIRRRLNVPLQTFSVGFADAPESEHETALAFARHLGTEHVDRIISPGASDFLEGIGALLDEPNADSSCMPTYLLSGFARESVTVALSGDGGDEMFLGYGRYFSTLDDERSQSLVLRRPYGGKWRPGAAYYSNRILVSQENHVRELMGDVPDGAARLLQRLRTGIDDSGTPLFCSLRRTDVENYMPGAVLSKVDRMSMRHGLEVRTPFLSRDIARFAERLPLEVLYDGRLGKRVLREVAYRYLPRHLIDLPKQGFGLPMSQWARTALLGVSARMLEGEESRLAAAFGRDAISSFLHRQRSPNGFAAYQVWALAMLESWLRHHPKARFAPLDSLRAKPGAQVLDFGRSAGHDQPQQAPDPEPAALLAWPLGTGVHVLLDNTAAPLDAMDVGDHEGAQVLLQALRLASAATPALDLLGTWSRQARARVPLQLPAWPLWSPASLSAAQRKALGGSILLFADSQPHATAGWKEYEFLRHIGVVAIAFFHPNRDDGSVYVLQFNRKPALQNLLDTWRLSRRSASRNAFQVAYRQPERTFVSDLLADLPDGESEFSDRYMLFEGFRQMPPVPVSHARIRSEGGGRYSIWGRRAHFSTTRFIRGAIDGNWIVEKSAANSSLLQFAPRIVEPRPQIESFIAALGQWVTQVSKPAERTPTSTDGPLVLVTDALRPGGAERQWCYLAVELRRRGYRVYFVVVSGLDGESGHYLPMLRDRDVPVLDLRRESVLQAIEDLPPDPASRQIAADTANPFQQKLPALVVLLRRLAPRAVLAQLDGPNLLAGAAALLAGVPQVLFSFRNYNPSHFPYLRNDWYLPMYQALLGSSRVRLCGNARLANEDYARWLGIAPARIAFVTNAIDPRRFEEPLPVRLAALRAALGVTAGTPVILGVFRLNEEKRPLFFIDVCAALAQRIPGLRVFIAGVGPEEAAMRKRIRELQMAPVIDMIGRRDDIQDLMALASVLLLTSTLEGMPNVVMEAQTLGVPVVATHVGGVADCLIDGKTGRLVSPDDFSSYVEYTYAILADPELRSTLGLAAAAHARNLFSPSLVADRYLELIDDQRAVDAVSNANKPVMGTAVDRRFP